MTATSTIATQLREARDIRSMSRADVAAAAGMHVSQLGRYEKGIVQPDVWSLVRLADALSVSADYLLGRSEDIEAGGRSLDGVAALFAQLAEHDRIAVVELIEILVRRRHER
jgi:transcriptional regulator with XRE-family HTH domain